jgi:gas vesicle protein
MSNNGGDHFLVGFFVGAAIGVMGTLLLAPKARREIQDTLAEEGKKLREKAEGTLSELRERGEDIQSRGEAAYTEAAEGVKKAARSFTKSGA